MKQPECIEGPEALGNFERLATAILQAPNKKKKQEKKPTSLGKPKKDWIVRIDGARLLADIFAELSDGVDPGTSTRTLSRARRLADGVAPTQAISRQQNQSGPKLPGPHGTSQRLPYMDSADV